MNIFGFGKTKRFVCPAPGGVYSPGTLGELARAAQQFGAPAIRVASDQSLVFELPDARAAKSFQNSAAARAFVATPDCRAPLCISSSVAALGVDRNPGTPWLTESVYLDLIALCDARAERSADASRPGRSVHIGDPRLSLSPRYPADWNFLAADIRHHWHLAHYDRHGLLHAAPYLLPSYMLGDVIDAFDKQAYANPDAPNESPDSHAPLQWIRETFADSILALTPASANIAELPPVPETIAAYEGLVESRDGATLWLGLFRPAPGFSPLFLDELAYLCRKHEVGRVYATHWHSLLVKHIPRESRDDWLALIARHGINLRHDGAALYWQVADAYESIRERIVQALRATDAGTAGLSFAVGSEALRSGALIAIVPENARVIGARFSIYHRRDFRREGLDWQKFAGRLGIRELVQATCELRETIQSRGSGLSSEVAAARARALSKGEFLKEAEGDRSELWNCSECRTTYDPRYGDARRSVAAGTAFADLPRDYHCPVCEAPREAFGPAARIPDRSGEATALISN